MAQVNLEIVSNTGLIRHYIAPKLGELRLKEITPRVLEMFYQGLLKTPAVPLMTDKKYRQTGKFVQPPTIRKIHNLLHSAFNQAEKWELIEKNPAKFATLPKYEMKERDIWDSQTLFHAIDCCEDERLKLCLNLAFSCSLRIGELLGLTWDCVDISEESIAAGKAHIVPHCRQQAAPARQHAQHGSYRQQGRADRIPRNRLAEQYRTDSEKAENAGQHPENFSAQDGC